jgi:hypothetical protein
MSHTRYTSEEIVQREQALYAVLALSGYRLRETA